MALASNFVRLKRMRRGRRGRRGIRYTTSSPTDSHAFLHDFSRELYLQLSVSSSFANIQERSEALVSMKR